MKVHDMYNKTYLDNGVKLISERIEHLKSVSVGIWVNTGSRDEDTRENGISHFIEHMIFKGTNNRSSLEIAKELDAIGGLSNAFTGKENTCFHTRVLGKHFEMCSDILSDIFMNSTFDPLDMERERQVVLQEISMVEDCPDDNIHELFNRSFWMGHPIGMSILGTGESISTIDKDRIVDYIRRFYIPERIIVVAAGNVDHDAMVSCFKPVFESIEGGRENPERVPPCPHSDVSLHYKELEQVHLCLGGRAPSQKDANRFACIVFNTILGGNMSSRLFQEIRENKGLAYSVFSFISSYVDAGMLGVYVATDRLQVNPVLETLHTEIDKLRRGDLSRADLIGAQEHLVGGVYLASESPDNHMMRVAKNEFVFGRYVSYEELARQLESVTMDDVVQVAGDVFSDGAVSLATLGPFREDDLDRSVLQFL